MEHNNETNEPELAAEQAALHIERGLELATKENYPVAAEILRRFGPDVTGKDLIEFGNDILKNAGNA